MVSGGRPNLVYSPGPSLWAFVLGPFGPDLGPGPEIDNRIVYDRREDVLFRLCQISAMLITVWLAAAGRPQLDFTLIPDLESFPQFIFLMDQLEI